MKYETVFLLLKFLNFNYHNSQQSLFVIRYDNGKIFGNWIDSYCYMLCGCCLLFYFNLECATVMPIHQQVGQLRTACGTVWPGHAQSNGAHRFSRCDKNKLVLYVWLWLFLLLSSPSSLSWLSVCVFVDMRVRMIVREHASLLHFNYFLNTELAKKMSWETNRQI